MTREEKAKQSFANGYNCAQAVLGVYCQEAGLDLDTALKLTSGFGGGMRRGEVCGAVSGAVMVIGLKCGFFAEGDFEQKNYCQRKTRAFMDAFAQENGSVLCRDLLGFDIRRADGVDKEMFKTVCPKMIAAAVRLLESMEGGFA